MSTTFESSGERLIRDLQETPNLRKKPVNELIGTRLENDGPLICHCDSDEQQKYGRIRNDRGQSRLRFHPVPASNQISPTSGVGGKLVDARKVSFLKVRLLVQHLLSGHTRREPPQNIPHRDSQTPHAGFPAALTGFDGYSASFDHRHSEICLRTVCPVSIPLQILSSFCHGFVMLPLTAHP